jgi:hypothetical protein
MQGMFHAKAQRGKAKTKIYFIACNNCHLSLTGSDFKTGAVFCRLLLMGMSHKRKPVGYFRVLVVVTKNV